jgi:hypothetical protein
MVQVLICQAAAPGYYEWEWMKTFRALKTPKVSVPLAQTAQVG